MTANEKIQEVFYRLRSFKTCEESFYDTHHKFCCWYLLLKKFDELFQVEYSYASDHNYIVYNPYDDETVFALCESFDVILNHYNVVVDPECTHLFRILIV